MLTCMEPALDIAQSAASTDPDVGSRRGVPASAHGAAEIVQVENARKLGWSWQDIAGRLGVTRQTVHRKHGKRTGSRECRAPDRTPAPLARALAHACRLTRR